MNKSSAKKTGRIGVLLAVAVGTAMSTAQPATAGPGEPSVMVQTVGREIIVSVSRGFAAGGVPDPNCTPTVREASFGGAPQFDWSPPTVSEAVASGATPNATNRSTVTVPRDGTYAVGAVCRDPWGQFFAPAIAVQVGNPAPVGPGIETTLWSQPIPIPTQITRAISITVHNSGSGGPCGAAVKQVAGLGNFEFQSSTPEQFADPGTSRTMSAIQPGPGTYAVVGMCGSTPSYPPVFLFVP
ncbi:hypothetical protein JGU71_16790 [Antrihabitans sp. YC3-6]|uniref:Secreted protein n=1 Tax=Antrihabitans stalagmiti TaxID=2799499 RepID=A0A934NSL6_9NOCA|nr:hypothetical protein [Antrihabitans stalagmiti]MBJ8340549.1 hypothetical protein [Antrihabitans stalagmiti]